MSDKIIVEYAAKIREQRGEIKKLTEALKDIAEARTCEKLNPGHEKYNNYELGWFGVREYAMKVLKDVSDNKTKTNS